MATNPVQNLVNQYSDPRNQNVAQRANQTLQNIRQTVASPGQPKGFTVKNSLSFGLRSVRQNLGFFIPLFILVIFFNYGPQAIINSIPNEYPLAITLATIIFWFLSTLVQIGKLRVLLDFTTNQPHRISTLFSQRRLFIKYYLASIVYTIITFLGFLLLIIPGIIFMLRFQFFGYVIVDKETKIIDAFKESWRITKGHTLKLLGLWIATALINIVGIIALVVGFIYTNATTNLAYTKTYQDIK